MIHRSFLLLLALLACNTLHLFATPPVQGVLPIDLTPAIAGNFGELRPNHFHTGVDFKTEGVVDKPIYAFDDGYISSIQISPGGYGKVLYIVHPTGLTSVYAHLNGFVAPLDSLVESVQYELESFAVRLLFRPEEHPVARGEQIALSGNTGSSQGPHLHFEIRRTDGNIALNPLDHLPLEFADSRPPTINSVLLSPLDDTSTVNARRRFSVFSVTPTHTLAHKARPTAWGRLEAGVRAIDRMDNSHHRFGISYVKLTVDSTVVSEIAIDEVPLSHSRHFNSFIHYAKWVEKRTFFITSYKQLGNRFALYSNLSSLDGAVEIDQERPYHFRYDVEDRAGNRSTVRFIVEGRRPTATPDTDDTDSPLAHHFAHTIDNQLTTDELELRLPAGTLFDDLSFRYHTGDTGSYAPIHTLHHREVPLGAPATLRMRILHDTATTPAHYYLARVDERGNKAYAGGAYRNGWIEGVIRELGSYTVGVDTEPPTIQPQSLTSNNIRFTISDARSGIRSYKATLDGSFLLLEHDAKSRSIAGKIPRKRFGSPKMRKFQLTVEDNCRNTTIFTRNILL